MPVVLSSFSYHLLRIIAFLFIPISILAPHGVVWTLLIGGMVAVYYSCKNSFVRFPKFLGVTLFMIPLWGGVTCLWAKYPMASLFMSLKVFTLIFLGIYWCRFVSSLPSSVQRSLSQLFLSGLLLGLFLLFIDMFFHNPWQTFWNKTSAKAFAQGTLMVGLGVWPFILWICKRPYAFYSRLTLLISFLLCVFGILLQIDCDSSFVGLILGICAFMGTLVLFRLTSFSLRFALPLFVMAFPFLSFVAFTPSHIPVYNVHLYSPSYIERLYIWNDVAESILVDPWKGVGMNGSRSHEKATQLRRWSYVDQKGKVHEKETQRLSVHPHNMILQLWLELGIVGFVLGVLLTYQIASQIYRSSLTLIEKAASAGLFMTTFLIVWVNLGFWQNWWIAGLWMVVGFMRTLSENEKIENL